MKTFTTLPRQPGRGGFRRPVRLGLYVREYLAMHGPQTGHALFVAYKTAIQSVPLADYGKIIKARIRRQMIKTARRTARQQGIAIARGGNPKIDEAAFEQQYKDYLQAHPNFKKRRACSYLSFMQYLYLMRQLNLIDYASVVPNTRVAGQKSNPGASSPDIAPAQLFELVASNINSVAWDDVWEAAYPGSRARSRP